MDNETLYSVIHVLRRQRDLTSWSYYRKIERKRGSLDPSVLEFSLSLHRHLFVCILFTSLCLLSP